MRGEKDRLLGTDEAEGLLLLFRLGIPDRLLSFPGVHLMLGQEKIAYIQTHTYYEYFSEFHSQLPYVVYELSTLTKYSLCFFLAALPKKSQAFPALVLYVLSAVPELIVGERNPIVLNVLFALSYYVIRDFFRREQEAAEKEDGIQGQMREKPWMGKFEKGVLILGVPAGLVLLGAMNYIREGNGGAGGPANVLSIIADLFYKQGVSFRWLALGYGAIPFLPHHGFTNYTFGSFIDYFCNGSIAQKFFGAVNLGSSNSWIKAHYGNNFSHHLSYILLGESQYLAGHGCGSSYLLEVFADYGYLGIILFSLILGFLLVYGPRLGGKNALLFSVLLLSVTNLFLILRAEATGFLQFVLTMQFWAAFVICCGGALIISHYFYPRKMEECNMKETSREEIRALQLKSLEILKVFDKFCRRHKLRYFLCGGCCIGTIRHQGFIPWDDDVDVFMPRPDYERLRKLWKQEMDEHQYALCRSGPGVFSPVHAYRYFR